MYHDVASYECYPCILHLHRTSTHVLALHAYIFVCTLKCGAHGDYILRMPDLLEDQLTDANTWRAHSSLAPWICCHSGANNVYDLYTRPVCMRISEGKCPAVDKDDGCGYIGQQRDTIVMFMSRAWLIQSTLSTLTPIFCQFWLIGYTYNIRCRCLNIEIW